VARKNKSSVRKNQLYLIVPSSEGAGPIVMDDKSVKNEGLREMWRGVVGGRKEVKVDADVVANQIHNYISVVKEVAEDSSVKSRGIRLDEITLSLTLSAEGNIGIASTSAEAGLTLVFKRS
jgi:hypothetical protein